MQENSFSNSLIRNILLAVAVGGALFCSVSVAAEFDKGSFERQTFSTSQVNDNQTADAKTDALKTGRYWASIKIQNTVTGERTTLYPLDVSFPDMALEMIFNYAYLNMQISSLVYKDSSEKAFAWVEEEARKKTIKLEDEFAAKQLARQNAAAQHALLASARYNELNDKAYQMGLAVHNRLAKIDQIVNTSIDKRDAYKAGVKLGRAMFKLDATSQSTNLPETKYVNSMTREQIIEADKASSGQKELDLIK